MNESLSPEALKERIVRRFPSFSRSTPPKIHTDATDFFNVGYGDVLLLDGTPYLVRQNAKEGRFGLDDEEKFWVKRAVDLDTGERKIVKLVFFEKFTAHVGRIAFQCFRSPKKEARILSLVKDHPHFMQGFSKVDAAGNTIRVLDVIVGPTLPALVERIDVGHEPYFHEHFPVILDRFIECIEAIRFLHDHGEKHGDIRRDHVFMDRDTDAYRWIDFDFNYKQRENIYGYDLFGLGNILIYLVGKGDVLLQDLAQKRHPALERITEDDRNIVFHNRVANLKRLYPYIPESLNRVLLHFSRGANWHYEHTVQLLEDIGDAMSRMA
jgi:hypothetical protein